MLRIWMSDVTCMTEFWIAHTQVAAMCVRYDSFVCKTMPHLYARPDTHSYARDDWFVRETRLTCVCVISYVWVCYDSFACKPMLHSLARHAAHLYVRHDSFVRETWVICMYDIIQSRGTWICDVTHPYRHLRRCCMCDRTSSYVRHDSIVCVTSLNHDGHEFVTWLFHINICVVAICVTWLNLMNTWVAAMCVILLDHTHHETFIRVIWRMRTCGMTHLYVWVDSWCASRALPCVCEVTQSWVRWHIPCDMTHCDVP